MHNTIILELASSMQTTRRRTRRLRVFLSGRPGEKDLQSYYIFLFYFYLSTSLFSDIDNSDLQHVGGSCIQAFLAAMGGPKSD
jgi:hypothetical protein